MPAYALPLLIVTLTERYGARHSYLRSASIANTSLPDGGVRRLEPTLLRSADSDTA